MFGVFFLLLFNKCRCVGVTSCHDQELAQIAEICVAGECLDFFSFFNNHGCVGV